MKTEDVTLGMLVVLNSGSPPLTVLDVDDDEEELTVTWLDATNAPQQMMAPAVCFKDFTEIVQS